MVRPPRLTDWEIFSILSAGNSIHQAASLLAIEPSTVKRSLDRLEKDLKVTLFFRSPRGLKLTDQGALYKDRVLPLINNLKLVSIPKKNVVLRVNFDPRISFTQLLALLNLYRQTEPGINFDLSEKESPGKVGDINIDLSPCNQRKRLTRTVFISPRLFIQKDRPVTLKQLLRFPYIAIKKDIEENHLSISSPVMTVTDADQAIKAAILGVGFCLAFPDRSVSRMVAAGSLQRLEVELPESGWQLKISSSCYDVESFIRSNIAVLTTNW
ncbi:LysR family transcriptional regulator [uncultured Parasutterella sp.]|mgnify:CR=1 FL=1|uniref:LysR family transcriptional regulator n=1 Tax=uncultured Parasutterella sp. TaxID=1263098 RepID=UPI0025FD15AC|nr:LysR family transcriptional regulator [uncultured Parasutterella sp.]